MWSVEAEDIEVSAVELDFSSSDQGRRSATAVSAAEHVFSTRLNLWSSNPRRRRSKFATSAVAPTAHRVVGWQSGASARVWFGSQRGIGWKLATGRCQSTDRPHSCKGKVRLVLNRPAWDRIRVLHSALPTVHALEPINSRDAARLCQWSAPGHVPGKFPDAPRTRCERLIAVTDGDLAAEADCLDRCLQDHFESRQAMELAPQSLSTCRSSSGSISRGFLVGMLGRLDDQTCYLIGDGLALFRGRVRERLLVQREVVGVSSFRSGKTN